ncbi:protein NRT1/ PTR FAMILY 5.4-like [Tasmannia lanceolata]|uniref:protein NRT1/ PTR FAMILY 5.4-like n=1 Tax=Tasmannia lanceolata TaxID=3420 RepID=UPI004062A814
MADGTQRKPLTGGWRSSIYLIGVEVGERFAYYGVSGNLITYMTNIMHDSTVVAAKNINVWSGVSTLLPFFGAFVADSYLGRYTTILFSSLIYLLGLINLVLVATVINPRLRKFFLFISLYLVSIGQGGHKPCVQAFGADQFDEESVEEKKAKNSFFNWWYFGICSGAASALVFVIYVQDNVGWGVGFGIPAISMAFSLLLFLWGRRSYRQRAPAGSPLTRIAQVLVAAARKRKLSSTRDNQGVDMEDPPGTRSLAHTNQFKFLDKASIIDEQDELSESKNDWRLCTMTQVEEIKLLIRLIPIWLSCLMYAVVYTLGGTFFTKQSSTVDTHIFSSFKVPPASLQVSTGLTAIISLPIYDRLLVPTLRKITKIPSGLTMLQRIGVGLFLSVIGMVVAALVEMKRHRIAGEFGLIDQPKATVPMSVWWLIPQYVITGVSDVFTIVGLQEFFYDQMPDGMRSMGSAAYLSIFGVGSFLSSVVIAVVEKINPKWLGNNLNDSHLDYYYWVLAGLSTLWLCLYMGVAKCFVYKQLQE